MSDADKKPDTPQAAPLAYQDPNAQPSSSGGLVKGAIIGAIAGLPASYWLQNEMVRAKLNVVDYTLGIFTHANDFSQNGLYGPVAMGVVGCAVLGAIVSRFLSKK